MTITIHHATAKKATANGVQLTSDTNGVHATFGKPARTFSGTNPKGLLDAAMATAMLEDSWPGLSIRQSDEADDSGFHVAITIGDEQVAFAEEANPAKVRQTALDLLDELTEEQADAMAAQAEEANDEGGSVVPATYKKQYAERAKLDGTDPNTCGDWLAVQLGGIVRVAVVEGKKKTRTSPERMLEICRVNKCDVEDLFAKHSQSGKNGWEGRFRMSAGIKLRHVVAAQGFLTVPAALSPKGKDEQRTAPKKWCADNALKVKEAKPKLKKAAGC